MKIPIRRHAALAAALAVAAVVLCIALLGGPPDRIWLRCDEDAPVGEFFEAPDGAEVPHGATMRDVGWTWAYYYLPQSRVRDLLLDAGLNVPLTVDFLATGRETTTATGRWREYRRCSSDDLNAWIGRPGFR